MQPNRNQERPIRPRGGQWSPREPAAALGMHICMPQGRCWPLAVASGPRTAVGLCGCNCGCTAQGWCCSAWLWLRAPVSSYPALCDRPHCGGKRKGWQFRILSCQPDVLDFEHMKCALSTQGVPFCFKGEGCRVIFPFCLADALLGTDLSRPSALFPRARLFCRLWVSQIQLSISLV